jgi:diphthamide synthase (EF-2-diphthine--ammonia ligase)
LFLTDIRAYRERLLAGSGIEPVFPLWQADTARLARQMCASGLRAVLVCVDPSRLAPALAGRVFDARLLAELPAGVDPCGENGEFHTCCCAGPMFAQSISVRTSRGVERDGFVFADVVLGEEPSPCA